MSLSSRANWVFPLNFRHGIWPLCLKVLRREANGWQVELIAVLATPLTFFLAFGLGLSSYMERVDGVSYVAFVTPGLISMTILLEGYRMGAWGMWLDRWYQGMLDEYRIKPISTWDIVIGEILGGFIISLIRGGVVALLLMLLSGLQWEWHHWIPYLVFMFSGSILFASFGTIVGTHFSKPDHIAQTQTILITPLLYLGGVFFPLSVFPESLRRFVELLPTTAVFEGGRQALLDGHWNWQALAVVVLSAAIAFPLATWMFDKKLSE